MKKKNYTGNAKNLVCRYINPLSDTPLSAEEEKKILKEYKSLVDKGLEDSPRAKELLDRLICANISNVIYIANRFGGNMPFEDKISEGIVGIVEAARKVDPKKKNRFSTYAKWWITKRIIEALRRESTIKITRYGFDSIKREKDGKNGDTFRFYAVTSIEAELARGGLLKDFLEDASLSPLENILKKESMHVVYRSLNSLPENQRKVIGMYYGIETGEETPVSEISKILGVTDNKTRKIKLRALKNMESYISENFGSYTCR